MEGLAEDLQCDTFVHVYVGDVEKPFFVQRSVLGRVSEYFDKAIESEIQNAPGSAPVLRFLDDEIQAWQALFYWIFVRDWPHDYILGELHAVQCWALGEKYGIADFQDDAIMELLFLAQDHGIQDLDATKQSFLTTKPGSKLRNFMAEELIVYIHEHEQNPVDLGISDWDAVPGFATAMITAYQRFNAVGDYKKFFQRYWKKVGGGTAHWRELLVGYGPKLQWTPEGSDLISY